MSVKRATNEHGNVDVRNPLPPGLVHIKGERLQAMCKKLRIRCAPAFVGFNGWRNYTPRFAGVVVMAKSADKLRSAIADRSG